MEKCTITGYIVFMNFIHVGITLQHNKEREYDRKKNYWKTYRKKRFASNNFQLLNLQIEFAVKGITCIICSLVIIWIFNNLH